MTPFGHPPDRYHCLLDEQPYYLVPPRLYRPEEAALFVTNQQCRFSWQRPAAEMESMMAQIRAVDDFLASDRIVWIHDLATGASWPYWVGPEYFGYLARMSPGQPVSRRLPPNVHWVLRNAEIIVPADHAPRRQWERSYLQGARHAQFRQGYTVFPNVIPPFHLGSLRRYYRAKIRSGSFSLGDGQVSRRFAAHNEAVSRFVQGQLMSIVGEIARVPIKPSYSYVAAYQSGSVLERHTDREQCEFSVTLCIDATPEPAQQSLWPIKLKTRNGVVSIWQYLGEGLLYRGRQLPHYRDRLPEGCTSTSLLLHYVHGNFSGQVN
jgi:hypothetical protein